MHDVHLNEALNAYGFLGHIYEIRKNITNR